MIFSIPFLRIVFTDIFIMNLSLWMEGSSAAISFDSLATIFTLCFGVSTPLTFLGVFFGKRDKVNFQNTGNLTVYILYIKCKMPLKHYNHF